MLVCVCPDEGTPRDGRKQQKEYFKEELKRLKTSLGKESSRIKPPPKYAGAHVLHRVCPMTEIALEMFSSKKSFTILVNWSTLFESFTAWWTSTPESTLWTTDHAGNV